MFLSEWFEFPESFKDEKLLEKWQKVKKVYDVVMKAIEQKRSQKEIGSSLECKITLGIKDEKLFEDLSSIEDLHYVFIVSQCAIQKGRLEKVTYSENEVDIFVEKADGKKCERCWNYSTTVGLNPEHPTLCKRCCENIM